MKRADRGNYERLDTTKPKMVGLAGAIHENTDR
jgi:hypothetical protein